MIKNYDSVVSQIAVEMRNLDRDGTKSLTGIYLYLDNKGFGTVDVFESTEGISKLVENHILVYEGTPQCYSEEPSMEDYTEWAMNALEEIFNKF